MHYAEFDDLTVLSPARGAGDGLPLCAVVRNEMYFLPAFLAHYRRLGIGHFVVLDDRSDDGTRPFLETQPDVTLVGSGRRYGDVLVPEAGPLSGAPTRAQIVWKCLLPSRFAPDRWSVLADADEFAVLPEGVTLGDVTAESDRLGARCVAGVMLDVYPPRVADLEAAGPFDPNGAWYFDGERHLKLRPDKDPRILYPGVRARLMAELGIVRPEPKDWLNRLIGKRRLPRYNALQKPVLRKWRPDDSLLSAHRTTVRPTTELLLPLRHFKFNHDAYRRIADALSVGQYVEGSKEYAALERILMEMRARNHGFLYRRSQPADAFAAFAATGNALLGALGG